jgi:glycerol-3-phosphate dehydrogenase (NAD(P)+)
LGESESPYRAHNFEAALFGAGAAEMAHMLRLLGGRQETILGLPGVGDMYVTSTGGRNVKAGRLVGAGLTFTEADERLEHVTLEGAAAIKVIGGALPKLTERGLIQPTDFPLMRHLYEVIGKDQPLAVPWDTLFPGGAEKHT